MFRTLTTAAVILFAANLWAECAPDYRSDKKAGVQIADVTIDEASGLDSSELAAIRNKLIGACADEDSDSLEQVIRAFFQNEGYFTAIVKDLELTTLEPLSRPKQVKLEATVTVGPLYHLAEVKFVGNHAVPEPKLRDVFSLRKGDIFKRSRITSGFVRLSKVYSKQGFGDSFFIPDTEKLGDFTILLTVTVNEGPQYHMSKLKIFARQQDAADRLQSQWRLPEGAVFDFEYPAEYLEANRALLPSNFDPSALQIVRNCPEASIEVRLILDQTSPELQSQASEVKCEESHDSAK